jgi:Domain of unknown function (DUF3362)
LRKITRDSEKVDIVRGDRRRRLHKAFLRYHDPNNWPLLREALKEMGRADLIGNGKKHLIPIFQPATDGSYASARRKNSSVAKSTTSAGAKSVALRTAKPATLAGGGAAGNRPRVTARVRPGAILTQHTGLPPRKQR